MLGVGQNAGLGHRAQAGARVKRQPVHTPPPQCGAELVRLRVAADQAGQAHRAPQRRQAGRHVARATRRVVLADPRHHGHRRFGRDPPHVPMHVLIQHHIANDQDGCFKHGGIKSKAPAIRSGRQVPDPATPILTEAATDANVRIRRGEANQAALSVQPLPTQPPGADRPREAAS